MMERKIKKSRRTSFLSLSHKPLLMPAIMKGSLWKTGTTLKKEKKYNITKETNKQRIKTKSNKKRTTRRPFFYYPYYTNPYKKLGSILKSVCERLQRSEGDEIDSEEAERSPLSSDFTLREGKSKKSDDNSDRKNDSAPERHVRTLSA
ncbi:hypothetical protein MKY85_23900 [Paenibacillus sp. FSL R5-0749]|uniref:hypothetical protein n=1 Tax=Paenibacillus sp. FSL R5-0749 TaxID=2921657 RepID=UPI00315B074B